MKKHFDHESRKIEEKKSVLSFCFHKIINIKIFSCRLFLLLVNPLLLLLTLKNCISIILTIANASLGSWDKMSKFFKIMAVNTSQN